VQIADVYDGLDARSRRCLSRLGTRYVRSSRVVADEDDYACLVGLAQAFRLRYPLVDGDGNFGSVDGDPPADPEYTRVRLAPIARDLERFPTLLVNGSETIPPHNLTEVVAAVLAVLDDASVGLDALLERLPGPDFPTGGAIVEPSTLREVYATGRGQVRIRARSHLEGETIVITELPYGVRKGGDDGVISEIVELMFDGTMRDRINDIQDHTDRRGQRLLIGVERGVEPNALLGELLELTSLETIFAVDFVALVNGDPERMTLRELIDRFIAARIEANVSPAGAPDATLAYASRSALLAQANNGSAAAGETDESVERRHSAEVPWLSRGRRRE
jgi:DNA gyrase subunit A